MSEDLIEYMWLDKNGQQMSPRHRKLRTALAFANGWHSEWDRLTKRIDRMEKEGMADVTGIEIKGKMSRTGEPPAKLVRVVSKIVDCTESETTMSQLMLENE